MPAKNKLTFSFSPPSEGSGEAVWRGAFILFNMKKPEYHILICNSYRVAGDAKGFCNKNGGADFVQYVTEECADRGIDAAVSSTACLNVCSQGPVMVIQPNNLWYGAINTERIDEILDALEEGEAVEEYLISE